MTHKETQRYYFRKQEDRRGYLLLHQVLHPQKRQSWEYATRYSLGATLESELNWGIKSSFSQHRASATNSEPPSGGNQQQDAVLVTTMPMETGLGTAAYGRGDKDLPGVGTHVADAATYSHIGQTGFILVNNLSQVQPPAPGAGGTGHFTSMGKLFPTFSPCSKTVASTVHSSLRWLWELHLSIVRNQSWSQRQNLLTSNSTIWTVTGQ